MVDHKPYGEHAARNTAKLAARTETLLDRSARSSIPLASIGSTLVVLLGFWLWVSVPVLYHPDTAAGWDTALREEALAVPLILAGLALRVWPRNLPAVVVAAVGGLVLVAVGIWAPHGVDRSAVSEVVTGVAVLGAALMARAPR
ncbi:MAG TPA: hypothetical protein VFG72_12465 [Marmoricola sp.]|nr:hypothetical protein [Marmoricola sp.]